MLTVALSVFVVISDWWKPARLPPRVIVNTPVPVLVTLTVPLTPPMLAIDWS